MFFRALVVSVTLLTCCAGVCCPVAHAFQCGPTNICPPALTPVCQPPVVPLAPCCEPSPVFPPGPPLVAPVIVQPVPVAFVPAGPPPFSSSVGPPPPMRNKPHRAN